MKKIFTLIGVVLFFISSAQTTTVSYTASTAVFSNPERGFFKFTETHSTNYKLVSQSSLTSYRTTQNLSLIYRCFYLEDFINVPISQTYLNNMQTDFNRIRAAGLKVIIRFAYTGDKNASPKDASRAQILAHLEQLKPLFIANSDVIAVMQAGFIGTWGEWYYTSQAEFGGWGYNQTNLTAANISYRKIVVNAMLAALPSNRMIQIRYPNMKQKICNVVSALPPTIAFNESTRSRIGHHNDCFLSSNTDVGTYQNVTTEYPYMEQETKYVPMGGESCAVFSSRTNCTTAQIELAKFHWSFLNKDYYPEVLQNFQTNNCYSDIEKNLGYRFQLITGVYPQSTYKIGTFPVTLTIKNVGYASPFNKRDAYIVMKNTSTNLSYPIKLNSDPRSWLGPNNIIISENLTLPLNLPVGTYKLYLHLPDADTSIATKPYYAIRFANNNTWESTTGYNNLNHTIIVTNTKPIVKVNTSELNINMYPVPTDTELTVEFDSVEEFNSTVYNAIGQKVDVRKTILNNKIIIDTQNLSNGMYFITFEKGAINESRKFMISH